MTRSSLRIAVCGTLAIVVVAAASIHQYLAANSDIPLPFASEGTSVLTGDLTSIGRKGTVSVIKVTFPTGVNSETLSQDTIYLVRTPDDAAVTTVTMDQALSVGGVHGVNYFGYRYVTPDAATEKAHKTDSLLKDRFPGQFFASEAARNADAAHGNALANFETTHNVVMVPTGDVSGGAKLEKNALYFLIVNETSPVTITVRSTVIACTADECGPQPSIPSTVCSDGSVAGVDACSRNQQGVCAWQIRQCPAETQVCGNGTREGSEQCDLGTANGTQCVPGAGSSCTFCNTQCMNETLHGASTSVCGNGTKEAGEFCDDGDTASGDGCSATCDVEQNFSCDDATEPSVCVCTAMPACAAPAEGCTYEGATCGSCGQLICDNNNPPPSVCGDGVLNAAETCDDGGTAAGDGCSAACAVESDFSCDTTVSPSTCISHLDRVKALADTNRDGTVSDTEALLVTLDLVDAPDKAYAQVKKFDMDLDGDVDNTDTLVIIDKLGQLAP